MMKLSEIKSIVEKEGRKLVDKRCALAGGDFSAFNFNGVYILSDKDGEVVYIGSAYIKDISKRLPQYFGNKKTRERFKKRIEEQHDDVEKIMPELYVSVIKHDDLEAKLIKKAQPKYNKAGKSGTLEKDGESEEE